MSAPTPDSRFVGVPDNLEDSIDRLAGHIRDTLKEIDRLRATNDELVAAARDAEKVLARALNDFEHMGVAFMDSDVALDRLRAALAKAGT